MTCLLVFCIFFANLKLGYPPEQAMLAVSTQSGLRSQSVAVSRARVQKGVLLSIDC